MPSMAITPRTSIDEIITNHPDKAPILLRYRLPKAGRGEAEQAEAWTTSASVEGAARSYGMSDADVARLIGELNGLSHRDADVDDKRRIRLLAFLKSETDIQFLQHGKRYIVDSGSVDWFRQNVKCQYACPVHTDVPGYIALIADGKYEDAYQLNRQANILPGILGRVCSHPCETACRACDVDGAISICRLKRSAADHRGEWKRTKKEPWRPEKVAIIGAGPAGLGAANDLALMGYGVTIHDKYHVPGGTLWSGIPEFRLPRDLVTAEVENIQDLGVDVKLNVEVGKDVTVDELRQQYDAVIVATGCMGPSKLRIPGEELDGMYYGIELMEEVNFTYRLKKMGRKVVVIGGGYTAMDCSRSAVRMGADEVWIVYRRSRAEMPVDEEERGETEREGVKFEYLVAPLELIGDPNGRIRGMRCVRTELGAPDARGRRSPVPIPGSEFVIECDTVVAAAGQFSINDFLPSDVQVAEREGRVLIDPRTYATTASGVFACGDFTTGPATVIEAIAHGRKAAVQVNRFLQGDRPRFRERAEFKLIHAMASPEDYLDAPLTTDMTEWTGTTMSRRLEWGDDYDVHGRTQNPMIHVPLRLTDFKREVETGFTRTLAYKEAKRCYQCQLNIIIDGQMCILCNACVDVCPMRIIEMVPLERIASLDGRTDIAALAREDLGQYGAAMVIDESTCIRCGLCVKRCPTGCLTMSHFTATGDPASLWNEPRKELAFA
ncbi:MAG: 4Fe-4S dicluster domain-containing protein [Chloroflexota bacterium]|nr:MAG: 4Fe-4S dicluster domain-containing protein [Chloroflexota bacterium]